MGGAGALQRSDSINVVTPVVRAAAAAMVDAAAMDEMIGTATSMSLDDKAGRPLRTTTRTQIGA